MNVIRFEVLQAFDFKTSLIKQFKNLKYLKIYFIIYVQDISKRLKRALIIYPLEISGQCKSKKCLK